MSDRRTHVTSSKLHRHFHSSFPRRYSNSGLGGFAWLLGLSLLSPQSLVTLLSSVLSLFPFFSPSLINAPVCTVRDDWVRRRQSAFVSVESV